VRAIRKLAPRLHVTPYYLEYGSEPDDGDSAELTQALSELTDLVARLGELEERLARLRLRLRTLASEGRLGSSR
jgi:hypothetical protein